ncbi:RagB/SusD family nutrient uptake outer membrane protein [uncultured Chitinophaga sp.]|uniref:RagB/SusD family nutrient uptake outer membrane protein n=1 Tax=uncultured Chitinophaga sp. TaxID=339340 RepID=UPI0025EDD5C0|nr:RagB/SusD family nutrient uptake outer membrane protein [uncultured Chitinophaga sp.]
MRLNRLLVIVLTVFLFFSSCKKYLDVVPDGVPTIDYVFRQRSTAEQYLFTCYSFMPKHGDLFANPAFMAGDELWFHYPYQLSGFTLDMRSWEIARGSQNVNKPLANYWRGEEGASSNLFEGIRYCNIMLENIGKVPHMEQYEKDQWTGEAMFLKAYFHYWLFRMYGPIPVIDKNTSINSSQEEVLVRRQPVDSCVNYIVAVIDSAITLLPEKALNIATEAGRINQAVARSVKAEVLITAASPLYNGNSIYAGFRDKEGKLLFNQDNDPQKWVRAMNAVQEAIDLVHSHNHRLNRFVSTSNVHAEVKTVMDFRTAITDNFNSEVVWGNTNSNANMIQNLAQPRINAANALNTACWSLSSVPLHVVNQFYSKNGVPITEDRTLDFSTRGAQTRVGSDAEKNYIEKGYTTAAINFDREPRFYASLGFDGSKVFGNGQPAGAEMFHLEAKQAQYTGWDGAPTRYNVTGYWPLKLVNHMNVLPTVTSYSVVQYAWPVIRLADLYLMYAEALNEVNGPGGETFRWIDSVRLRAGVPAVQEAWTNYSSNPGKINSKEGMRDIIHRERLIEFAFEGQRFWDLRRWKEAERVWQVPIQGWNYGQKDLVGYYSFTTLFNRTFRLRDYFWPIKEEDLIRNKNLVQNPGW